MAKVRGYVDDLNAQPGQLCQGQRGPCSKYELPEEELQGRLELKFFENVGKGVSGVMRAQGGGVGWVRAVQAGDMGRAFRRLELKFLENAGKGVSSEDCSYRRALCAVTLKPTSRVEQVAG